MKWIKLDNVVQSRARPAQALWPAEIAQEGQILLGSQVRQGLKSIFQLEHRRINGKYYFTKKKKKTIIGCTWVAQSVKCPTSAQVMISRSVSLSPAVGGGADSSEPGAYFGFCVSLSLCPSPTRTHTLSPSQK